MKKNKIKIIISWCLVFIWMVVIFSYSNMDSTKSNTQSKDTINKVIETTIDTSNKIGIIDEKPTIGEKQLIIDKLNKPLRKCMHFTVYCILALLLLNTINKTKVKNKYFITIIICFLYAITDEYHQTFISGRTGQFSDVLIDTIGATTGIIIYNIIKQLIRKKDKNKQNNKKRDKKR